MTWEGGVVGGGGWKRKKQREREVVGEQEGEDVKEKKNELKEGWQRRARGCRNCVCRLSIPAPQTAAAAAMAR
jgi:hypothetical protein